MALLHLAGHQRLTVTSALGCEQQKSRSRSASGSASSRGQAIGQDCLTGTSHASANWRLLLKDGLHQVVMPLQGNETSRLDPIELAGPPDPSGRNPSCMEVAGSKECLVNPIEPDSEAKRVGPYVANEPRGPAEAVVHLAGRVQRSNCSGGPVARAVLK